MRCCVCIVCFCIVCFCIWSVNGDAISIASIAGIVCGIGEERARNGKGSPLVDNIYSRKTSDYLLAGCAGHHDSLATTRRISSGEVSPDLTTCRAEP